MLVIQWVQLHLWLCTTIDLMLEKSIPNFALLFCQYNPFRVRLANFLAPVASEKEMAGPLGWIAGFMDGLFDWVMEV